MHCAYCIDSTGEIIKSSKEFLRELLWNEQVEFEGESYKVIEDKYEDSSRWAEHRLMVFQSENNKKYYVAGYSRGLTLTEVQDERPFEYEPAMIECTEVEPVETVIIEYKPVER